MPGDSKTALSEFSQQKTFETYWQTKPKVPRETLCITTAGLTFLTTHFKWRLFAKATSVNDGKLKQRHVRPDFTGSIFKATSRCQEPTSARLFETLRRYELWDPAWSTRGLPPLPDVHFEKAHGAPFSWERLNRSRPQTKTESDKIGGI